MTTTGNTSLVLARSASSTAVCSTVDQQAVNAQVPIDYLFQLTGTLAPTRPLRIMYDAVVTSGWVALGVVRPDVASVQIIAPTGEAMPVELQDNTFTAQYATPVHKSAPDLSRDAVAHLQQAMWADWVTHS